MYFYWQMGDAVTTLWVTVYIVLTLALIGAVVFMAWEKKDKKGGPRKSEKGVFNHTTAMATMWTCIGLIVAWLMAGPMRLHQHGVTAFLMGLSALGAALLTYVIASLVVEYFHKKHIKYRWDNRRPQEGERDEEDHHWQVLSALQGLPPKK